MLISSTWKFVDTITCCILKVDALAVNTPKNRRQGEIGKLNLSSKQSCLRRQRCFWSITWVKRPPQILRDYIANNLAWEKCMVWSTVNILWSSSCLGSFHSSTVKRWHAWTHTGAHAWTFLPQSTIQHS